jgi:hypothetical protein
MVFMLSVVIGFYVIGNVHHALHTPLMSVTNAISGIIVVGALLQVGHDNKWLVTVIAFIGILVASINVFGGFTVTAECSRCSSERTQAMTRPSPWSRAPTSSPGCSSSSRWPGCPSTRPPRWATATASSAWAIALVITTLAARHRRKSAGGRRTASGWALGLIAVAMAIGAVIGITLARKVEMTGMPELIAMLHSFVGARGGARRLELLLRGRRPIRRSTTSRSSSASSSAR